MTVLYLKNHGYIDDVRDLHIVEVFNSGERELNFAIHTDHRLYRHIFEESGLVYAGQDYLVKSIDEQGDMSVISCRLDLDTLQMGGITDYRETNQHLFTLLNFALTGTGWTYTGADRVSIRRTTELEGGNALDLLRKAQEVYRCVFWYDTAKRLLTVFPLEAFEYKGVYFTDELNIGKALLRGDSFEFCTRLIPIGAEGMRIDEINGGKSYVENHEYSSKIVTKVWKDERYTDMQSLKDDAIEKLKVLSNPNRTYSLDVIDLAAVNSEYSHLSFKVGDKVMLVDRNRNVKVEHQVARLVTYPDNPQKNRAELAATAKGFESIVQNLTGMIDGANVVINIQGRRISQLTLDFEAFTLKLADFYTRGETETFVAAQIKAEATRIDLIVSEQTSRINNLTGEVEVVGKNVSELSVTVGGFDARISNAEGQVSTLSQTVGGFDTRITNAEGQVSSLSQTVGGFDTRITNAEGQVSSLSQTIGGFETRISNAEGSVSTLSQTVGGLATRVTTAEGNISSIDQTVSSISTRISTAEGNITTVTQTANKINWLVAGGTSESNFTITPRLISLMSTALNIESFVTFTALGAQGQTTINGGNITTGSINATLITVGTLDASNANITNLNANNINAGTLNSQRLSSDVVLTTGAQTISGNKTFSGTTTISGNISASSQTVTPAQLGHLSGVSSNIQTQFNGINTSINSINTVLNGKQNTLPSGNNTQFLRGDITWQTIRQVPTGGSAGQFLRQDLTWQTISALPTGGSAGNFLTGGGTSTPSWTAIRQVPTGGTTGQFLRQDLTWQTPPAQMPTGGTSGQFLRSNGTSAASWEAIRQVPAGGTAGQFLRQDLTWQTPPAQMPTGGTSGQFLRSNGASAASWEAIRQVPTGGTAGNFLTGGGTSTPSWAAIRQVPTGGSAGQFLRQDLTWQAVTIPADITVNTITASGFNRRLGSTTSSFLELFIGSGRLMQEGPGNFLTLRNTANDGVRLQAAGRVELVASNNIMMLIGSAQIMFCDANGIRIGGTSWASQRIGFYNVTPITRQSGWSNLTNTAWNTAERDRINAITTFLRTIGLTT